MFIGAEFGSQPNAVFTGLIDEVEFFDRALGLAEIQAIYNAGAAGKCKGNVQEVKIVFTSNRDGNFEIYSMNTDGAGVMRLTTNPAVEAFPALSPDATKIAFTSNRDADQKRHLTSIFT